jgi:hypothetical protein
MVRTAVLSICGRGYTPAQPLKSILKASTATSLSHDTPISLHIEAPAFDGSQMESFKADLVRVEPEAAIKRVYPKNQFLAPCSGTARHVSLVQCAPSRLRKLLRGEQRVIPVRYLSGERWVRGRAYRVSQ